MAKQWKEWQTLLFWAPKSLHMVIAAMKLKDAYSLGEKLWPNFSSVAQLFLTFATSWNAACQASLSITNSWSFQQHEKRLYTWTSPDGQHWNHTDYILCSRRWRSFIQSAKTRPGADYGSDQVLLIAKFRLNLKKVGETLDHSVWPKSYPLRLYSGGDE